MNLPKIPSLLDVDVRDCPYMSVHQAKMLVKLGIVEMDLRRRKLYEELEFCEDHANEMGFMGKVMFKRLKYFKVPVTFTCAAFTLLLCKNLGDVVLWCYTFNRIFNKTRRIVDLQEISQRFPHGFPNESAMIETWDAQKGYRYKDENGDELQVDNIIDLSQPWELDPEE